MEKRHFRPYIQNQIVLFPERVDKDIAEDDPVRFISAIVDCLDLEPFKKLYYTMGR
ncbi:MAG: IS1182 family transposase, partial [Porphyromonas sp.]|nr:IS1182 family transposase [Porphyromonas sp.]